MSSSDGSFDLSSEYGAELCSQSLDCRNLCDSDHDPLPDSTSAVSASDQDLLPDSASIDSTVSSEASSHRCDSPEPPKTLVRQKRRLCMIDEDKDGVRIKVVPSFKQKFRRQMQQTNRLRDDFFLPNRAQLVLNFLKKHGDQLVKEKPRPKKRFASTLRLVQHVLKQKKKRCRIFQHFLCLSCVHVNLFAILHPTMFALNDIKQLLFTALSYILTDSLTISCS